MSLDDYLGTKAPPHWKPSKGRVPDSKCWFNDEVVRVYGPKYSCADPTKGYCDGKCKWGPVCEECGQRRIRSHDLCAGEVVICINPECAMDK